MKNIIVTFLVLSLALFAAGCGQKPQVEKQGQAPGNQQEPAKQIVLKVGATPVPHAEILRAAVPLLEKKGIKLEIQEFTDYATPNKALAEGSLDANYFQHVPYLEDFAKANNLNLIWTVKVHFEPLGVYSQKIKALSELKDGASIAVPNDATNEARALLLLQDNGLIKLKADAGMKATPKDIVENKKNLKIQELEAAQIPRSLQDVDAAVINANFALDAKLNPAKDALVAEKKGSLAADTYGNIVAIRKGDENRPEIKALNEVLTSPEIKKFIEDKYQGAVIPVF